MYISGVSGSLRDANRAEETINRLSRQLITGQKIERAADDPTTWLEAARGQSAAGLLDVIHTGLTKAATNIQIADTTMQAIGSQLAIMQSALQQALESAPGDQARTDSLTNFNTVLQQIDGLVYSTPQPGARSLLSGGNMDVLSGLQGEQKTIRGQQVDTGPAGLAISAMPLNATEAEIGSALANLAAAQTALTAKRQSLSADAGDVERYQTESTAIAGFYQSESEALTAADFTEAAVELQSVNVQRSLAMQTLAGISGMRDAVLELLH